MASASGSQNPLFKYMSDLPVRAKETAGSDYFNLAGNLLKHLKGKRLGRPQKPIDPLKMKVIAEKTKESQFSDEFGSLVF